MALSYPLPICTEKGNETAVKSMHMAGNANLAWCIYKDMFISTSSVFLQHQQM
jgi:hypothetical protein